MPNANEPTTGDPLDAVIAEYVQQVEAGQIPDRESLLAKHPEVAERLRDFFADYDRLDRQAAELRLSADPNRTTDSPGPEGDLPRVRYFGDYELLEVIARGGMGVVYKARQVSLNRVVALKMVLRGELATARDVARFRTEAEAAANLDHPHIVPIYEVGEHEGQQYYAMRYVEGASLARRPRSDARSEAQLVATIAGAVHHAHRRGVLHRDIKPSNILVDTASSPLVADFGLAKRVDADRSLTESGAIVGTPRYMAPEQAAGRKDLTVAVDVYSLGVVLYERLTGQTPFTGETVLELLRQAREEEPPRPSSVCPGLDRDLETICLKCLEKDPSNRYASAKALQDDLERWLCGEPIAARPVGQAERLWRWCRRNPVVAGLSAGLAAAFLAGTAISLMFGLQERHARIRAEQAEDGLEQALARSLVRPLISEGDASIQLSEPEADALWELAEKSGNDFWLRFVAEATRTSVTVNQLSNRAEPAWIAAVGLDQDKRRRAEELLRERLETVDVSGRQQLDLANAAVTLGDLAPVSSQRIVNILVVALASKDKSVNHWRVADTLVNSTQWVDPREAARFLAQALEKATDAHARFGLARGLAVVAGRMDPSEVARILTLALEKETYALPHEALAEALAAVTARMEPAESARLLGQAANILTKALEKEKDANACNMVAKGLVATVGRMEPRESARVLSLALEKATGAQARGELAQALAAVAGRMELREAARVSGQAASNLTRILEKQTDAGDRRALTKGLAAIAERMEPRKAARVTEQAASILTLALEKETSPNALHSLAWGLAAVAGRMELREAARVTEQAASILSPALEKATDTNPRYWLSDGLVAVAGRMEPREAARLLTLALGKATNDGRSSWLVEGLVAVTGRMEPREAARVTGQAASILTLALEKETNPNALHPLAGGLAIVAGRMESHDAAKVSMQAASILALALEKTTDSNVRPSLALGLAELAERMETPEAVRVLTLAIEKETNTEARCHLAHGLASLAGRLSRDEATTVCQPVMQRLLQAVETEKDELKRQILARAVARLLSASDNLDASRVLAKVAFAVCSCRSASNQEEFYSLGIDVLDALLNDDSRSEVRRRALWAATVVGSVSALPFPALPALPAASEPLPCRLSTQDLVELLKMPTCFGEARKVVLKHLGNRYGRVFANHWQFVRFAQEQHLDLDLTSPPKRWRRP